MSKIELIKIDAKVITTNSDEPDYGKNLFLINDRFNSQKYFYSEMDSLQLLNYIDGTIKAFKVEYYKNQMATLYKVLDKIAKEDDLSDENFKKISDCLKFLNENGTLNEYLNSEGQKA